MVTENAKLVCQELKSGNFTQDYGHLRAEAGYCCLGVICEVYRLQTGKGEWIHNKTNTEIYIFETEGFRTDTYLPPAVRDWIGFTHTMGIVYGIEGENSLMTDNDGLKRTHPESPQYVAPKTFDEIADIILSDPPGLFMEHD